MPEVETSGLHSVPTIPGPGEPEAAPAVSVGLYFEELEGPVPRGHQHKSGGHFLPLLREIGTCA